MPGIDVNILFSALFTQLGMAGSIGVVLFVGGRWTARIEERLSAVENRFGDVDRRMTEGFATIHQRFDDVDLRFDDMNKRFDDVNIRIDSLETRNANLKERVGHLEVRMGEIPEVTIDRLMNLFQLREAVIATTTEASKNAR